MKGHLIEIDVLYKKRIIKEGTCLHYRSKTIFLVKEVIDYNSEEHIKKARIDLCYIPETYYANYILILEFKSKIF